MFSSEQIQEILDIIEFQSNFFIAGNISGKFLNKEDKDFLKKLNIDFETQFKDFTPFQQAFYFGRLVSILGPLKSKDVNLNDFKKYLRRGQFHALSDYEKKTLEYLEDKTFSHIKDLKETIKTTIINKVKEVELINREQYEKVIKDSVKRSVIERNTVSSIVSEIGNYTKDWSRDLGRIAETEMQNAYEYGKITSFNEEDEDNKYYKHVYGGACKHCIRLYLKDGIGSEPYLFSYNELLANGTNIGKKVNDWKATIGPIHPFCRCDLRRKRKNDVWDSESKTFVPEKRGKSAGEIKILVGDKTFIV